MKNSLVAILLVISGQAFTQTDYAYQTFDDTRVVNGQSVETTTGGNLKFIIAHRFGAISSGAQNAWGLDMANMRIGLDYGLTDNFTIGIGRSSFEKTFDGFVKYKLLQQSSGDRNMPISCAFLGGTSYKSLKRTDGLDVTAADRLAHTLQLLIARKFSDRLSLQVMPTYLHRNLVEDFEENDIYSVGIAGQYQAFKNISFSAEYYATPKGMLPSKEESITGNAYTQSLAIGMQIDTKGHIFQLHFGNSQGMIEKFFVAETTDRWLKGGVHFGFNITRDFKVRGRKL